MRIDHLAVFIEADADRQPVDLLAGRGGLQQHLVRGDDPLAGGRRDRHGFAVGDARDRFRRDGAPVERDVREGRDGGEKCERDRAPREEALHGAVLRNQAWRGVEESAAIDASAMALATITYQAGANGLPVCCVSHARIAGAKPPKIVVAML